MPIPRPDSGQIDIDPDLLDVTPRRGRLAEQAPIVAVIAIGGALGACARYGAGLLWPTAAGTFPVTTLSVNISGCAIMGVFMVLVTEIWTAHRLLRPFVGTGILGGYTTFSTYAVDITHLVDSGHAAAGLTLLATTPAAALAAIWSTASLTHRIVTRRTG
ncbi:CrcB family protein [Nocardia sp. NPDC049220]|uniref:fluoride efflux transporter FluC n=1 Tax=Nocardia sp. NPDC049220 TaxID=3155273 RepID=UPI00340DDF8D